MEEDIPDLQFISRHKAYALILGPDVRKPAHTFPIIQPLPVFLIKNIDQLYVRITMTGRYRCRQNAHDTISAGFIFSADQTDQLILFNVYADRNLMQETEFIFYCLRFILQGIVDQCKLFFRNIDRHLKGRIAQSQSLIQKIIMSAVSIP